MRNPFFGKWLSDDDRDARLDLKESSIGPSSCVPTSSELILSLENEKARLKGLLKERGLSQKQNFESFVFGSRSSDDDKAFEDIMSLRTIKCAIKDINFKIKVLKGKARV